MNERGRLGWTVRPRGCQESIRRILCPRRMQNGQPIAIYHLPPQLKQPFGESTGGGLCCLLLLQLVVEDLSLSFGKAHSLLEGELFCVLVQIICKHQGLRGRGRVRVCAWTENSFEQWVFTCFD